MKEFDDMQEAYAKAVEDRSAVLDELETRYGIKRRDFEKFILVNDAVDTLFRARPGIVFLEGFFTALQLFRTELDLVKAQLTGEANEHSN